MRYLVGVIALTCIGIFIGGQFGVLKTPPPKPEGSLRIFAINLLAGNKLKSEFQQRLVDAQADIVVLLEWNGYNLDVSKFEGYKTVIDMPSRGVHGLAVLSRLPGRATFSESPIRSPCSLPMGTFSFTYGGERFLLFAVHAPPPIPACGSTTAPYIDFIARQVANGRLASGERVLIAGDLNSFPLQAAIRDLRTRGLKDAWSAWSPFAPTWRGLARIDYVFFPADLESAGAYRIKIEGSDHLGILQDLLMPYMQR